MKNRDIITKLVLPIASAIGIYQASADIVSDTKVSNEGAIFVSWTSESNAVYRVEYGQVLVSNMQWQTLCDSYPSHGTNTFWLDTGNYFVNPPIVHPKNEGARFYRVVNIGTNSAAPPTVAITGPTNDFVASGTMAVTVSASSSQPVLSTKLYVDGEEMPTSSDGSNYVINTCEWPNGPHVLFASAESMSGFPGTMDGTTVNIGRAVSPYVTVTFSNLISRLAFSEVLFDPTSGQTQQVSAVFAAGVDWTLQIQDESSNSVRTATGSGITMQFDWDGTGEGGTNLPAGLYNFLLSAQTNGQSYTNGGSGGGEPSPPPSPGGNSMTGSSSENWYPASAIGALRAGLTSYFIPPPPMPLVELNGQWVPWEEVYGSLPLIEVPITARIQQKFLQTSTAGTLSSPLVGESLDYGGPTSQATRGPTIPPASPSKGVSGTFGLAYQDYGPNGLSIDSPRDSPQLGSSYVKLQGSTQRTHSFLTLPTHQSATDFIAHMARGGWRPGFVKANNDLSAAALRKADAGGSNIFNSSGVNLGLLMCHGVYGTSPDYYANGAQQIYFPIKAGASGSWVRMSEMDFGSAGTNGLKWMAILGCYSLRHGNWNSAGIMPFNSNLHLFMGADSLSDLASYVPSMFAKYLCGLDGNARRTVMQAWYDCGSFCLTGQSVKFAVAGYNNCRTDTLQTNFPTGGGVFYDSRTVR